MEIIAHRGASQEAPENTLAAFALGWSQVDICELDIWSTSDGHLLVCHDASTRRTTGVERLICRHTLAELQELDAGSWKGPDYAGEKLPSLAEVLKLMPAGKRLLLEIKGGMNVVSLLRAELETSAKRDRVAVQSFDDEVCSQSKQALPHLAVHYLSELSLDSESGLMTPPVDELIEKAAVARLDGLGLQNQPVIDAAYVERIHDAGLRLNVWTVDNPAEARRLRDSHVDGVITNRPGWLCAQLASP